MCLYIDPPEVSENAIGYGFREKTVNAYFGRFPTQVFPRTMRFIARGQATWPFVLKWKTVGRAGDAPRGFAPQRSHKTRHFLNWISTARSVSHIRIYVIYLINRYFRTYGNQLHEKKTYTLCSCGETTWESTEFYLLDEKLDCTCNNHRCLSTWQVYLVFLSIFLRRFYKWKMSI